MNIPVDTCELGKIAWLHRECGGEVLMGNVICGFLSYYPKRTFFFWDLSFTHLCRPKKEILEEGRKG